MTEKQDKRHHNPGRPPGTYRYGEPAKRHYLMLTDTAWKWLKEQGGTKWIEEKAREN